MSLRALHADVQGSLLKGDSFVYAHLLKFERVIKTQSAKPSESATDYSYVTDASVDISWDDGSKDVSDDPNGAQTYIANRLLKVGGINETTEAKASNLAVTVSSVALGATMVGSASNRINLTRVNTSTYPYTGALTLLDSNVDDWIESGFSEGDKVTITHPTSDWNGLEATIDTFTGDNKTANITFVGKTQPAAYQVNQSNVTVDLSTDEVVAILNDPNSTTYAGYINREVFIYKAHINPDTGAIIGEPYLVFKGIIAKAKLSEDPSKDSKVTWSLTSHWGDFVRINGRRTSDGDHRALSNKGAPDPSSLHRFEYAGDMGFMHSETAVNIIAIYQVMETRYKMKSSGFLGLKKKMKEYQVEVDRDVDLRINLEAKYLPIIYGVNRVDSIPVFADSLKSDSAMIYVVYAICEGEVSGIYDIYVDDQSRICIDKNDNDTRATQTAEKTIDVICEGRMDRGDTLSSSATSNRASGVNTGLPMGGGAFLGPFGNTLYYLQGRNFGRNRAPVINNNSDAGVTHEKQTTLEYPIKTTLQFHAGRPYQRANDMLTGIASGGTGNGTGGFKLQGDLAEDKDNYWNANHRLLDTAYVAAEFEIAEGDVTIPQLDFVVRGKEIEQYNYDYSYNVAPNVLPATAATLRSTYFKVGDKVDFYDGAGNALAQDVQIAALNKYINSREEEIWKYRFVSDPLNGQAKTSFKMVVNGEAHNHASAYWMVTWDHKALSSNVLTKTLTKPVTTNNSDSNATMTDNNTTGGVDITNLPTDLQTWIDYLKATGGLTISIMGTSFTITAEDLLANLAQFTLDSEGTNPTVKTNGSDTELELPTGESAGGDILITNGLYIGDATGVVTSTTENPTLNDDYYKGQRVRITQTDANGGLKTQTREIIGYDASEKIIYTGSFGPIEENSASVGNFTCADTRPYPTRTAKLTSVSGLTVGNVIERVLSTTSGANAYIPLDTKITNIDTTNKIITVDKDCSFPKDSIVSSAVSTNSSSTVATAHPFEFMPLGTDKSSVANTKWEILPPGDTKVSINPAAQLLDYLINDRYGKGLDLDKDIDLPSFQATMRACDTRSDVTLVLPDGTYNVGDKYSLTTTVDVDGTATNFFQWQGTVKSSYAIPSGTYAAYTTVTFTDCIGKIAHKWYNWKSFDRGNIIYHKVGDVNRIYRVDTTGVISTAPSGGNATTLTITKEGGGNVNVFLGADVSGNGGSTATESSWDHNPVVKNYDSDEGNFSPSGYSLYDSDDVKYWRYLGWQNHNQDEVTRHQTNCVIRSETPLFDNVNSMLEHFNGILRYSNGKYELDLKTEAPTIPSTITYGGIAYTEPRRIHADDIIGTITVDDAGLKGSANTVSVGISDPAIRYDKRSVSFYNSEYLKEDRGIPKKKTVKTPLITNYFNARMNAEQYLIDSRYARKISFQLGPQGALLLAGSVILITYPRFGWENKEFRISNLQIKEDCLVQVTAEEHDDSVYKIGAKKRALGPNAGGRSAGGTGRAGGGGKAPDNPTGLTATGTNNAINLAWDNAGNFGYKTKKGKNMEVAWNTVIYRNTSNSFASAVPITTFSPTTASEAITSYKDPFPDITSDTTYYYWIKHVRSGISSVVHPTAANGTDAGNGVSATAISVGGSTGILYLYKSSINEPTDDPSDDNLFPTVTVTLSGTDAGKITGVPSGQGSAALTNNQIIDTAGNGTGWYIEPVDPTDEDHVVWVVAGTGSSSGSTDEIARAEWTEPVKWSGGTGLSTAQVTLYQLTNSSSAPADPSGDLVYTFASQALTTNNLNNWTTAASSPSANNQYLWRITAAAIGRKDTHTIPAADWSAAVIHSQFVVGGTGTDAKAVKLTANKYAIPFTEAGTESSTLTFTATPQGLTGTGTYKFDVDAGSGFVEKQAASTTATYTMAQNDEPTSGDAHVVKVTMYDGGTSVATDSVSVYGVQDGSDALTVVFTNEAHVMPAATNGTVSTYAGSGTDIRVYRGATLLTAATSGTTTNTFKATASASSITASSSTGSTANVLGTSDTLRYADHSNMTADSASITYTITVYTSAGTTTITKVQSFSKSKKGETGDTPDAPADGTDAARVITGIVYWQGAASGETTSSITSDHKPSNTDCDYNFNTTFSDSAFSPAIGGGSVGTTDNSVARNNWSVTPPAASSTREKVFYLPFTATETLSSGNHTGSGDVTFGDVTEGISFTGVVTFSGDTLTSANGNTMNITAINGSTITTGFLKSSGTDVSSTNGSQFQSAAGRTYINLDNGAISSHNFRVGSDGTVALRGSTGTGAGQGAITLNSDDQKIVITDGTADRVILGKLS